MAGKPTILICTDGGAKGNPGPAACAAVLKTADDGQIVLDRGKYLGNATNNVAEYEGVLLGLELAAELGAEAIEIRSDSELLVRQVTGVYKVKNAGLRPLYERVLAALKPFARVEIRHVPRGENVEADALVNETIRRHRGKGRPASDKDAGQSGAFRLK